MTTGRQDSFGARLVRFAGKPLPEKREAVGELPRRAVLSWRAAADWRRRLSAARRYLRAHRGEQTASEAELAAYGMIASASPGAGVPAIIFQTWKSKVDFPRDFRVWMSTFIQKNPAFRHVLWDDDDNRKFIASCFQWFLPIYDAYPKEIFRADAVRYFFLYTFGGIYADMDAECLKPLDGLLHRGGVLLGRMGRDARFRHSVPNATMASKPREEFWLLVIWVMIMEAQRRRLRAADNATGPVILKAALDFYRRPWARQPCRMAIEAVARCLPPHLQPRGGPSDVIILPSYEWFPIDWSDAAGQRLREEALRASAVDSAFKRKLFPDSSIVSYWAHSW